MTYRQPHSAGPMCRRSILGLLGAAPLAAGALPATSAAAGTFANGTGVDAGRDRCGDPPADLRPGGAYDRHLTAMAAGDRFSGTVLLACRGRPVLTRSFGWADKKHNIRNRAGTIFNLGSVTKIFTGVAVAQLAALGKIDFSATVGTYLDGFPAQVAGTVTVHQLLTHTAGMSNYSTAEYAEEAKSWHSAAAVFDGTVDYIRTLPLQFTPGTKYDYSNTGFYVLGAIVAQASGQSYYDYIRRHIFSAAGMTRSDFYTRPQQLADRDIAHPYATDPDGRREDVAGQEGYVGGPDHAAFTTGPDLLAFAGALQGGTLLTPAFAELALSGHYPVAQATGEPPAQSISIGYGVENLIVNNHRVYGHPGGAPGVNTDLNIYPDLDWVAAVLGNYNFDVAALLQLQNQLITQQTPCDRRP